MAEEILNEPFTDLNDLENKIGRKTPESLLSFMRDAAASWESGGRSGAPDVENHHSAFSDSLSDKLYKLKQEMRWLRSADVRILQQLLVVHEGIETMRWLMEDRGTLTSRGSNSTASLSSLTEEEEEEELSLSHFRESPGSSRPQHTRETTSEEAAHQKQQLSDSGSPSHFEPREARPPSPPSSKFEVGPSARGNKKSPAVTPADSLVVAVSTSQKHGPGQVRLRTRSGAETIRRALLRCSTTRKLSLDGTFDFPQVSGEKDSVRPREERFTVSQSPANGEKAPLGYSTGTQWYFIDPKDDVTFL